MESFLIKAQALSKGKGSRKRLNFGQILLKIEPYASIMHYLFPNLLRKGADAHVVALFSVYEVIPSKESIPALELIPALESIPLRN